MKDFMFRMPTKVMFGAGISKKLPEIAAGLNAKKVFLLTGPNVVKTDIIKTIRESLDSSGMDYVLYSDIETDPPIEIVDKTAEILRDSNADLVVAVGGGSPMDTAKAVCMLQTNEGSIRDYLFGGTKTVTNPCMPLICIPTTAGSGSEMTAAAVITDKQNGIKLSVTNDLLMPKVALLDPALQTGMPQSVTASTGMDALTHAIEAYVSLNATPLSDMCALYAMETIGKNLRLAVANGNNLEARGNMAIASSIAAVAFLNGGLGVVHGIAQAMGGIAHTPHGVANALILPYAMKRNIIGNLQKFRDIAVALGENVEGKTLREAAELSAKAVMQLAVDLQIPIKLSDPRINITKDMFPKIIEGTMAYRLLAINPCKLYEKDIENILEEAFE